ncbi:50S ribosomal protein L19 [Candidatus Cerribacteria bacterium 'Amazon FNV 2010 28 9']|uniref:50S ribosomal protein L19 n=1 Tax=Candidatus Cerribacteria bacterium 'Amazon FNV 2010 28 9' TaxID=2081795 RepID=A0A317JNA4_9BACT|nr:MAG: 50S ribosomal protein L19 [Candidatus Cerribacteria bacterium 'Amazon FNV 2010 28 9']
MAKYLDFKNKQFSVGDTVRVHFNVKDGDKTRIQIFEGILIAIANREAGKTFTVRKIAASGIGVEKIVPVGSPVIADIEMVTQGDVRRGKLYYLRGRVGKGASRVKKAVISKEEAAPAITQ